MKKVLIYCDKCGETAGIEGESGKCNVVRINDRVYDFCTPCISTLMDELEGKGQAIDNVGLVPPCEKAVEHEHRFHL